MLKKISSCFIALIICISYSYAVSNLTSTELNVDDNAMVVKYGSVGIGISNPAATLDVVGNTRFHKTAGFANEQSATAAGSNPVSIDWTNGNKYRLTISTSATTTLTFVNLSAPAIAANLTLIIDHQNTGGITWPANVKWPGGTAPSLSTTTGRIDIVNFYYYNNTYYGIVAHNYY